MNFTQLNGSTTTLKAGDKGIVSIETSQVKFSGLETVQVEYTKEPKLAAVASAVIIFGIILAPMTITAYK